MKNFFNVNNPIFVTIGKIFDLMVLSIIWLVLCIPVITIGPATTALYYTVVKVLRRNRGYAIGEFFKAFKENFKQSAMLGGIVTFFAVLLYFNIRFSRELLTQGNLIGLFMFYGSLFMVFLLSSFAIYLYPLISRFFLDKMDLVKLALVMVLKHFMSTLSMFVLVGAFLVVVYMFPPFIIIVPGLVTLFVSFLMENVLKKYTPKPDPDSDLSDEDLWYLE